MEYGNGTRNFRTQLKSAVLLISSHFEHHGSVSVARAQYICIGHGPRSRFRGVRGEMKSTVFYGDNIPFRMGTSQ